MSGKIKKMIEKKLEKDNVTIDPNVLHAKKKKYILLVCQKITQIVQVKVILLMISSGEKLWHYRAI